MNDIIKFQDEATMWAIKAFGILVSTNIQERNNRFAEESIELLQSLDMKEEDLIAMIKNVYSRDKGETHQEVGGVMVTLAVLVSANRLSLNQCARTELTRIQRPENITRIREKHNKKFMALKTDKT